MLYFHSWFILARTVQFDVKIKMMFWTILAILVGFVHSQTATNVKNVLTELFTTRSYNKLVRPTTNQSDPSGVYIEFVLFGINDVDEIQQKLTTTAYLEVYWTDEFLTWDAASYGGLDEVYVPQTDVWKPDIALQNGFKDLKELGSSFIQVSILNDGLMTWLPFHVFESKCSLDATYFPFEKQSCNIDFVAWSLNGDDVYLMVGTDGIIMDEGLESNSQWTIVSSASTSLSESRESKVRFTIVIKRKPLFFIINIILPIILLSILNIFTFQIPADIGERMGYTVTVWLSFAVFLTIISSSLPQSSDTVPVLSIYIMIQLVVGTISVLLSSWESRAVGHAEEVKVPWYMNRIALLIRRKCCNKKISATEQRDQNLTEKQVEQISDHDLKTGQTEVSWKEGISALDAVCFWFLTIVLAVSTMVMLLVTGLHN